MKLNTVICGDIFNVMPNIADKSIDMILTDMPYNTTACDWDKEVIPLDKLWDGFKRIIKDNGAIVLFGSEPFSSKLRMSNIKDYKYDWKWKKSKASGHLNAKKQPLRDIEDIIIFYKKQCLYNPQGVIATHKKQNKKNTDCTVGNGYGNYGKHNKNTIQLVGNYPKQTLLFQKPSKNLHPTQKPVSLIGYLIKTYTNKGDTVFDGFAGSGTTGVACQNLNRNYILVEKERKHIDITNRRLAQGILKI